MKKILIIDDEEKITKNIKLRLEANGYATEVAFTGKEGIEKANQYKPDLIILDIILPDLSGTEVAEALKSNPKTTNIPVVFLTCLVDKEEEAKDNDYIIGGNTLLGKPYSAEELLGVIKNKLGESK